MNLVYGEVTELFVDDGLRMARVRVAGARWKVPLELVTDARPGDRVLLCDGVALGKVLAVGAVEEPNDVPRDTREIG